MEVEEALGSSVPFSLKPILVDLERGRYTVSIIPATLADLVTGRRSDGGSAPKGGGGGGVGVSGGGRSGDIQILKQTLPMVTASWGLARVRVRYDAHLPSLFLQDR